MVHAFRGHGAPRRAAPLVALITASALLAGCASTAATGTTTPVAAPASSLGTVLGIDPAAAGNGKDLAWKLGAALPMSGPGAPQGTEMKQAIDLAIEQIRAAGGPAISLSVKDIKNPDPVASKQAARELADEKVAAKITSYGDGLGAMLEDTAKDQILTLDGVGGAQPFAVGAPYFYGTTAVAPGDTLPGTLAWLKAAHPEAKTVGLVGWEMGPFNDAIKADLANKVQGAGLEFNGLWETVSPTTQDFSTVIAKVKANKPDVIIVGMGAQAPGALTAQFTAAGINSTLIGIEYTDTAKDASKGTFGKGAYSFAMNYFDATAPTNPLAKLFVDAYAAKYPGSPAPSFYAANAYEETIAFWQILRGTIKAGGDVTKGADLLKALEANPDLPSVYGGETAKVGVTTIDRTTHGVASRPMGVYQYKDGKVRTLATFNIGGKDLVVNK
jgi:branched-chain amino acid transport system substrate-binding protein